MTSHMTIHLTLHMTSHMIDQSHDQSHAVVMWVQTGSRWIALLQRIWLFKHIQGCMSCSFSHTHTHIHPFYLKKLTFANQCWLDYGSINMSLVSCFFSFFLPGGCKCFSLESIVVRKKFLFVNLTIVVLKKMNIDEEKESLPFCVHRPPQSRKPWLQTFAVGLLTLWTRRFLLDADKRYSTVQLPWKQRASRLP